MILVYVYIYIYYFFFWVIHQLLSREDDCNHHKMRQSCSRWPESMNYEAKEGDHYWLVLKPTPMKNMDRQKWVHLHQFSGWEFQKYEWNYQPATNNQLKYLLLISSSRTTTKILNVLVFTYAHLTPKRQIDLLSSKLQSDLSIQALAISAPRHARSLVASWKKAGHLSGMKNVMSGFGIVYSIQLLQNLLKIVLCEWCCDTIQNVNCEETTTVAFFPKCKKTIVSLTQYCRNLIWIWFAKEGQETNAALPVTF